jgi:RND family efflux transporter MFP subunit
MKMENKYSKTKSKTKASKITVIIVRFILPVVLLILGGLYTVHLLKTAPQSQRKSSSKKARLVEVVSIEPSNIPIKINAMGTVIAAQEVNLKPQVSGKIIELNPELIRGGTFKKDQMLMKIEPDDYELLVQQSQSDAASAQSNLKLEYGNQDISELEYKLLDVDVSEDDKELLLRKPQLIDVQSKLQTAQAKLQQAKIDLERTNITAPFNSIVKSKDIDLGAMVSQSSSLVTLIGTDEYWVEVMVPVGQLKWINIPKENNGTGSKVKIYNSSAWGDEIYRTGSVIRLCPDLETNGRMAQLLVSLKDPLLLNSKEAGHKLLLGSYVRVEIKGQTIESAYALGRGMLHDGDNVWILTPENSLKIQPIKVLHRGENRVIVSSGIDADDKLITTDLAAPVEGMPLRLQSEKTKARTAGNKTKGKKRTQKSSGPKAK